MPQAFGTALPSNKRKVDSSATRVSPPPVKRKIQSGTTKNAVTNFFTPASQKPKERTTWSERGPSDGAQPTLLVGRYEPTTKEEQPSKRRKIAAFDLDSTLITPLSGKKHGDSATDWKWWDSGVLGRLKALYSEEGYRVVVLSNQGGLTLHPADTESKATKAKLADRLAAFKQKCNAVLSHIDIPASVYAATARDIYRKPSTGMWTEIIDDYDLKGGIDLENSFFVGDAGGRVADAKITKKDFSCSDRNFAHNVGIKYLSPEEFFLGEAPRDFSRDFDLTDHPAPPSTDDPSTLFEKKNKQDIVILCGPPGAGKSTFFWKYLKPLGYERVNQDILKSRDKCIQAAKSHLSDGESVAIDNTNPDPETRAIWVELAKEYRVPVRCVWLKTPLAICEHNDTVRALNKGMNPEARSGLPKMAFNFFATRYREPKMKEGFQDITEVEFKFRGTTEEYSIWGRYWI